MFERLVLRERFRCGCDRDIEIWVKEGKVRFSMSVYPNYISVRDVVSTVSVEELSQKLDNLGILQWKRYYILEDCVVNDGEFWIVQYKDSLRKRKKVIEGSDFFPDNWREFLVVLTEIVGY